MITREQIVVLAQQCGFTTGEYNAGDGSGTKVPFVAFDGVNMLSALERFAELVASPVTPALDEERERAEFEAWFSVYHNIACSEYGGLDCTNPKDISYDAWQAGRATLELCRA